MGMAHVTSGRSNLTYSDLINAKPTAIPKSFIPKTLLKRMLIRENELRLSEEYQKRYQQAEQTSSSSWLDVTDQLQREVIREFHLDDEMDEALLCLRCATQIYPDLKEIPLYVRYNRARDGDLQIGDLAPDVPVVQFDGQESQLFDGLKSSPTVLISELYNMYNNDLNFRFIYILEAHAQDEWPVSSSRWCPTEKPIKYNQTRTNEERLIVAKDFLRDFDVRMPMVIDKPEENLFEKFYAPWPVRIYVIDQDHRLTYKAQPSETMLDLKELTEHLELITQ